MLRTGLLSLVALGWLGLTPAAFANSTPLDPHGARTEAVQAEGPETQAEQRRDAFRALRSRERPERRHFSPGVDPQTLNNLNSLNLNHLSIVGGAQFP